MDWWIWSPTTLPNPSTTMAFTLSGAALSVVYHPLQTIGVRSVAICGIYESNCIAMNVIMPYTGCTLYNLKLNLV